MVRITCGWTNIRYATWNSSAAGKSVERSQFDRGDRQDPNPMGARLLRQWMVMPLRNKAAIEQRHDGVALFVEHYKQAQKLQKILARLAIGNGWYACRRRTDQPTGSALLGYALEQTAQARQLLEQMLVIQAQAFAGQGLSNNRLRVAAEETPASANKTVLPQVAVLDPCPELVDTLHKTLVEAPPAQMGKGQVVADGFDPQLDELRYMVAHNKEYLQELQQRTALETGITSLKIGFNNVFGYYIEVRNTHKDKVPPEWIRKQTL